VMSVHKPHHMAEVALWKPVPSIMGLLGSSI
jgi:hypothetical protein